MIYHTLFADHTHFSVILNSIVSMKFYWGKCPSFPIMVATPLNPYSLNETLSSFHLMHLKIAVSIIKMANQIYKGSD